MFYKYHFNKKFSTGITVSWSGRQIKTYEVIEKIPRTESFRNTTWEHYLSIQGDYRHNHYKGSYYSIYMAVYVGFVVG